MFDDVVEDVKAHVERVVSAKVDELKERIAGLLSVCAKETSVREESDAMKALLSGIETRFREEHALLVEAINGHTEATKEQTKLLEALFGEAKTMNGKVDVLCSHTGRLENVERDVATTANAVKTVESNAGVVSTHVSTLNERVDDIRLVFDDKIRAIKAFGASFSGRDLDTMTKGISALKSWTGKASATIIYDSKKDPFTDQGLFDKVKGKANIAVIGFTTDGDVFGGFYSVAVTEQRVEFFDPNMFVFSFESHGRCHTPQRFVVKQGLKAKANVYFFKNNINGFVGFYVNMAGEFRLGNERSNSYCRDLSDAFEGLENTTLTGKNLTCDEGPYHHCTRLVAVQLS